MDHWIFDGKEGWAITKENNFSKALKSKKKIRARVELPNSSPSNISWSIHYKIMPKHKKSIKKHPFDLLSTK